MGLRHHDERLRLQSETESNETNECSAQHIENKLEQQIQRLLLRGADLGVNCEVEQSRNVELQQETPRLHDELKAAQRHNEAQSQGARAPKR